MINAEISWNDNCEWKLIEKAYSDRCDIAPPQLGQKTLHSVVSGRLDYQPVYSPQFDLKVFVT